MTMAEFGNDLAKVFQQLSRAQQERARKEMYEATTGKPHRAETSPSQPKVSEVLTIYDSHFLRSVGVFVSACEVGLARLLDERFASQAALHFDREIVNSPDDMEFLLEAGAADWEQWKHVPMFHRAIRCRWLDALAGSDADQARIRAMNVGYQWIDPPRAPFDRQLTREDRTLLRDMGTR
jgi:hypothetical protein